MVTQKKQEIDSEEIYPTLANYDEDNYDYRSVWKGRHYEQWAENHILARARGIFHGETRQLSNWEPKTLTTEDVPFVNFHLAAVRRTLSDNGWDTTLAASANNFRRWDQVLPELAKAPVRPLIYGL